MTVPERWQPPTREFSRIEPLPPSAPAPNWYPDHLNPGLLRYWDGQRWTEYRQPAQAAPQAVIYNNVSASGGSDAALHLVLTLLTCGLWLPVWILIEIVRAISR